ncbi:MAG: hypothetical protein EGQ30_00405 [Clostridiales bacterium]|nr:hypothetical protein [Clostridiales bacterium]
MLFKWIKISFSVRTKKEKVSQPLQVRQYGFIKKPEKALPQAAFSKNPVISFSVLRAKQSKAPSERAVLLFCVREGMNAQRQGYESEGRITRRVRRE